MPENAVYVGRDRLSEAVEHFTEMWSDLVWSRSSSSTQVRTWSSR